MCAETRTIRKLASNLHIPQYILQVSKNYAIFLVKKIRVSFLSL